MPPLRRPSERGRCDAVTSVPFGARTSSPNPAGARPPMCEITRWRESNQRAMSMPP